MAVAFLIAFLASADRSVAADSRSRSGDRQSISSAAAIFLLIFDGNIMLLVGGMGLYYVYLIFSDQTRREAQGKSSRLSAEGGVPAEGCAASLRKGLNNLRRVMRPPPSMLTERNTPSETMDDAGLQGTCRW
jgi:hypothetical protein